MTSEEMLTYLFLGNRKETLWNNEHFYLFLTSSQSYAVGTSWEDFFLTKTKQKPQKINNISAHGS